MRHKFGISAAYSLFIQLACFVQREIGYLYNEFSNYFGSDTH